jgi:hypothetical protein
VWKGDGGRAVTSFAIVTTNTAPSVSQFDDWMRGTPDQAAALMKPYAGEIESPRVCRRLQLLRRWSHDEQDNEQVFAGDP